MNWAKKKVIRFQAWQLGKNTPMERKLIRQGRIRKREDGLYELFSLEATGRVGQIASAGDYFKVDPPGCPYPNRLDVFERSHRHIEADWYEQIAAPVQIWMAYDPECEEIDYLLASGQLRIHPDDPARYFSAKLWGTEETAARNAVIVLYEIERDDEGVIRSVDFNFVERGYFDRTYDIVSTIREAAGDGAWS